MNKYVLIIVGGSIGMGIGGFIYKKFIKPKFDKENEELEEKINQAMNEMIEEDIRHKKAMEDIERGYEEWKKAHDDEFEKWKADFEKKCEQIRKDHNLTDG